MASSICVVLAKSTNNLRNFTNLRNIRSPAVVLFHDTFTMPRIVRPEGERRGCPHSQSMASGDLTITLSRVGSFRAERHGALRCANFSRS
jgi:hypothetical protein